jgi:hypothetical protein
LDRNVCLILGSGASYASGYSCPRESEGFSLSDTKPPKDEDFFKVVKINRDIFPALGLLLSEKNLNSLEHVYSLIDSGYKFRSKEWTETKEGRGEELKKFILDWGFSNIRDYFDFLNRMEEKYFNGWIKVKKEAEFNKTKIESTPHYFTGHCGTELRTLIYRIYAKAKIEGALTNILAKKIIQPLIGIKDCGHLDVLTFNYDLLVEKSISACKEKFSYVGLSGFSQYIPSPIPGDDGFSVNSIPIIKLHGSLNWVHQGFDLPILFQSEPVEPYFTPENNILFRQPAIVPPVIKKAISEPPRDFYEKVMYQQWSYAETVLRRASHLVIVGYRFPETDNHTRHFFKRICDLNPSKRKILYCCGTTNLSNDLKEFIRSIGDLKDENMKLEGMENLGDDQIKTFVQT